MTDDHATSALRWLASIDPRITAIRGTVPGAAFLDLQAPPGAEYRFRLLFYENEFTLAAVLSREPDAQIFWHQQFERLGASSVDPVEQAFRDFALDLMSHESRIIQRRGLLFHRFTCEVRRATGWERAGGRVLALRTQFRAPVIEGRMRVYHSPPLVARS